MQFSDTNPKHADSDNVLLAKIAQAVTAGGGSGDGGISEIPEPLPVKNLQITDVSDVPRIELGYTAAAGGFFVITNLDAPTPVFSYSFATDMLFVNNLTVNGTLTGTLTGNASTASALQTARTINGTSFNGTANIVIPPYQIDTHSTLTYAATTNIDFTAENFRTETLTGNVTFTTSNLAAGRSVTIRIIGDSSLRTLTFPGGWKFVGNAAPASLDANKTAIITVTSFGTTDANVIAAYAVEP